MEHITLVQEVMINKEPATCTELFKDHYEKIEAFILNYKDPQCIAMKGPRFVIFAKSSSI